MNRSSLQALIASTLIALAAQTSQAATISFTDTLPTEDTILTNTTLSSAGALQVRNMGTGTNNRWTGTGFRAPETTTLDRITLFIKDHDVGSGALSAEMTISFYALASQTASPADGSSPLYSESATFPAAYNNEDYITYDLETPFALTEGSFYGVMISFDEAYANRSFNFRTAPGGAGGTGDLGHLFYTYDLRATYTNASNPAAFVFQTIPEPSTSAAIFGILTGAAAFLYRRRRARR